MSKILANQIANYGDDAPIEIKEGLNIPAGKPIQAAGSAGSSGQVLSTTGTSIAWVAVFDGNYNSLSNRPTIPTQTSQLTNNSGFITGTDVRSANEATSTGQSSTTSTSFADKVTLSSPTVSNSRVLVAYSYDKRHSDTSNKNCVGRVTGTNVSFVGGNKDDSWKHTYYERFQGTILDISSHTGTRTYRIQWRQSGGGNGTIQNASLTAIEMSV